MPKNLQAISSFLTERKIRIKPDEANSSGLARIEKIDFSGTIHLAEGKDTKTDMILIKKGDLVISGINVAKGALAVYEGDDDVIATIHYSAYIFDVEKIDIEFLKWFLKSPAFVDALIDQTGGGIKTEIKAKKFLSLKIPLPIFEEQKQIELKLNSFQERHLNAVRELEKQAKLMTKLRASILSDAVNGRLVPQDPNEESASILLEKIRAEKERLIKEGKIKREKSLSPIAEDKIPYELPEGWVWVTLLDLFAVIGGATPNKSISAYWNGNIPWVSPKDMKIEYLSDAQDHVTELAFIETRLPVIPENSLLIVVRGMILLHSFPIALTSVPVAINQDMKALSPFLNEVIPYLMVVLKGHKKLLLDLVAHSTHGTCKLESHKLFAFKFGLPPLAEQHRIVAKVEQLTITCDALEAEVAKSRTETDRLMQTILKEAFNAS